MEGYENYLDNKLAHDREKSGLTYLSNLDNAEEILKDPNIKKFACVRNPYSRILSAYLNKINERITKLHDSDGEDDHFLKIARDIDKYRKEYLNDISNEINFYVFLKWLKDSNSWFTKNEHWNTEIDLLHIDKVTYNIIGRFENLATDSEEILYAMGCDITFPTQKDVNFAPTGASNKLQNFYDDSCYELVNSVYKKDFEYFAYPMLNSKIKNIGDATDSMNIKEGSESINSYPLSIINTTFLRGGNYCKKYFFSEGEHVITKPIILDSFDIIKGEGSAQTILHVKGEFPGPVIQTTNLKNNCDIKPWLEEDGVPIRFTIKGITLDLSEWTPESDNYNFSYGSLSESGIGLYGKGYKIDDVTILNSPGCGMISVGSVKGGKKDYYKDSPEAVIDNLEIINTKQTGLIFGGPHDSLLRQIIVSHAKEKGVYIICDKEISGACDIGYIHAYATDNIAIHIHGKVKAHFLQADTGREAGVLISGTDRTLIETIEAFKIRSTDGNGYAVRILSAEGQYGLIRIRADAGANGMELEGYGNMVQNLHINMEGPHPDFQHLPINWPIIPLMISGPENTIQSARIINIKTQPIVVKDGSNVDRTSIYMQIKASDNSMDIELPSQLKDCNIKIDNYSD